MPLAPGPWRRTITHPLHSSIWLILAFKVPLAALIALIVWWASRGPDDDEASSSDEDGGIRRPQPHPRTPFPTRHPRRGPHGGVPTAPPSRVRPVRARARTSHR